MYNFFVKPKQKLDVALPEEQPPAFTLMEILVVIAIIAVISSVVISAISPQKTLQSVQDARRLKNIKELQSATYQHLIYEADLPDSGALQEGEENKKPICKESVSDAECALLGAISFRVLPPEYMAALPVDPVVPETDACIGYEAYTNIGRPIIVASNIGNLPGDPAEGICGPAVGGGSSSSASSSSSVSSVSSASASSASSASSVAACGDLIAYWDFDEGAGTTAVDQIGGSDGTLINMNHAVLNDGSGWTDSDIPTNLLSFSTHAIEFDKINDFIVAGDVPYETPYTFTFWAKIPNNARDKIRVLYSHLRGSVRMGGYNTEESFETGNPGIPCQDLVPADSLCSSLYESQLPGIAKSCVGASEIDTEWNHYAVSVQEATPPYDFDIDLYANGIRRSGSVVGAGDFSWTPGGPFYFGRYSDPPYATDPDYSYGGLIDDFRIYGSALTEEDINAIYNGGECN